MTAPTPIPVVSSPVAAPSRFTKDKSNLDGPLNQGQLTRAISKT
jgi:hypothetical protein